MTSGPSGAHRPTRITTINADIVNPSAAIREPKVKTSVYQKRKFVMWDGEATQDGAGYCLFGNSDGAEICGANLGTKDCLDLILSSQGRSFHFAFAFDYDVNNILRDLPWTRLIILKETGRCEWQGYHIRHIPHKSFSVKKDGVTVRIDDVFSYFRSRYDKALLKYGIGDAFAILMIAQGKDDRPNFKFSDIDEHIRPYWKLELELGVKLMNRLREVIHGAGFLIGNWHGPGALAGYALRSQGTLKHMKPIPEEMSYAARVGYAGGWFERFRAGVFYGSVYTADINAAYTYSLSKLPSLANGEWFHQMEPDPMLSKRVRLGLFKVRFSHGFSAWMASNHGMPLPLFQRGSAGNVSHPFRNEGWYWQNEAALVASDPGTEFLEAWIFADDGTYPFAWVEDMFEQRLALQAENDPAEKALKWAMASMYGRVAQRAGWNMRTHSAPKWHQLEWAGAITSLCRSMIFTAALPVAKKGGLCSIDTDGIMSTVPFSRLPNGAGNQLGRWKLEEFSGVIYIQTGIYWLRDMQGNWQPPKSRGIPTGQIDNPRIALEALGKDGIIRLSRHNFVGYGAAIRGRRKDWLQWVDSEYSINVHRGGNRQHIPRICRSCKQGLRMDEALHDLAMARTIDDESSPHKLPWLEPDDDSLNERLRHELMEWA